VISLAAEKFKIALKLEKKDEDLNLLLKYHVAKKVIIDVIKAHKNDGRVNLKLPQYQKNLPLKQYYRYTYNIAGNEDVIEWLSKIEPGYKNHALKTLIRHAMEKPDIRHYETKNVGPEKEKKLNGTPRQKQAPPKENDTMNMPPADTKTPEKVTVTVPKTRTAATTTEQPISEPDNQPKGVNEQMTDLLDMLD
jgi:hypothetical protein